MEGLKSPDYPPPEPCVLRMDANTNLMGLNPAVERVACRLAGLDLQQYPSCLSDPLRDALAREHGVSRDEILVGDGSDEMLDVVCKTFLNPGDTIVYPVPTFVMYAFLGRVHMARAVEVPLRKPGYGLDVDGLLRARAKIAFIASPNNPTGNAFAPADLDRLLRESQGLVLIDEAYADFCGQEFVSQVRKYDNLIVSKTFSKSHGLAGLRVGYAVASKGIMEKMVRAKTPITLGTISEAIALEALADKTFCREGIAIVRKERERLAGLLAALGFRPEKTDANFLIVDLGVPSDGARAFLRRKGILTRAMGDFPGLEKHLRVTVGRPEHNDRLAAALKEWKSSG